MKNKAQEMESIFRTTIKDLLIKSFKKGKVKSYERGAICALDDVRNFIGILAEVTGDKKLSSILIDMNVISTYLSASKNAFIETYFKEELQQLGRDEADIEIILNIFNRENYNVFIDEDTIQDQNLFEILNKTIEIMPLPEKENMIHDICKSILKGFKRASFEEMPKLMEEFYDNIIDAIEKESYKDLKDILEAETLRWHHSSMGFP